MGIEIGRFEFEYGGRFYFGFENNIELIVWKNSYDD